MMENQSLFYCNKSKIYLCQKSYEEKKKSNRHEQLKFIFSFKQLCKFGVVGEELFQSQQSTSNSTCLYIVVLRDDICIADNVRIQGAKGSRGKRSMPATEYTLS